MLNNLENFDIYLGTIAGSLLHFNLGKNNKKTVYLRNDENCEITALSWGRIHQEILIGYKKGIIKSFNLSTEETTRISPQENSKIIGVVPFENDILFATNKGNLYQWTDGKTEVFLKNEDDKRTLEKIVINPYDENILGIGGVNYDIKLFDITTKKVKFQGKADRHDELELAQPISINSIAYFDNTLGMDIGTVTKQGQIRIYDTRTQRRPIKIYKNPNSVYTTICRTNVDKEICVGTTKGYLQVIDLRNKIKPLKTFEGFMGGLTDIFCDEETPFVASCCLDRHFRIHNLEEKKLEYEEYVKIQAPLMLMRQKKFITPPTDIEETTADNKRPGDEETKKIKKLKISS